MSAYYSSGRRRFVRNLILGAGAVLLLPESLLAADRKKSIKLTVLHTNDMHSHIDPFPNDDPKYPGYGGMERRAALVKKIREEEEHVLLLDAGDIFQGTPYFNLFGGKPELELMSHMNYNAATLGNHDFDNGLEGFVAVQPHATFPFICSNYDFSETVLAGKTVPNLVLERGPLRVGLFGLGIELNGLVMEKNYGKTRYLDPIQTAKEQCRILRKEKNCDLIICLSHLGYEYNSEKISDLKLAKKGLDIDLIIGGHTHTFLDTATEVKNESGRTTLVNQAGWGGIRLGRIDFYFHKDNKKQGITGEFSYIAGSNSDVC